MDGDTGETATPTPDEVLAAIEHTLDNATFKLGRLRHRNRGASISRDLTSIFYDVSAARHDITRLRDQLASFTDAEGE